MIGAPAPSGAQAVPLLGHELAMERLRRSVGAGRVASAYLLVGPDGIGKTSLARWFAQLLSCQAADAPCGRCARCLRLGEGTCPDLTLFEEVSHPFTLHAGLFPGHGPAQLDAALAELHRAGLLASVPRGPGAVRVCHLLGPDCTSADPEAELASALKGHDLQSLPVQIARRLFLRSAAVRYARSLKIDLVRRYILRQVPLRPVEMAYRLFVLDDAHTMPIEAQNALLKTLEEPPPSSVLLLVTSRPNQILPTIASRCQRLTLRGLASGDLARLLERLGAAEADAHLAAELAGGSVLRALDFSAAEHRERRDALIEALAAALHAGRAEASSRLSGALGGGAGGRERAERTRWIERQLRLLLELVRDALVLASAAPAERLRHRERHDALAELARLGPARLGRVAELVLDGLERLSTNASADLQALALGSRLYEALAR